MRIKQRWKQWIAMILVIALSVTSVPVSQVQAETDSSVKAVEFLSDLAAAAESRAKASAEAREDAKSSSVLKQQWYVAHHVDGLAWNFFHNKVQDDIVFNYKEKGVRKEIPIIYKDKNGKPTGKQGRADIGMEIDGKIYLWEVKPVSYWKDAGKKAKAEVQLKGYVDSDKNFDTGGNQINGGEITYSDTYDRGEYYEDVTYLITYTVENNGLIIYEFERTAKKREKQKQEEAERAPATLPEKDKAVADVTGNIDPKTVVCITTAGATTIVGIVAAWMAYHEKLIEKKAANSLSITIVAVGTSIIARLTEYIASPETVEAAEVNAAVDDFLLLMEMFGSDEAVEQIMHELTENDEEAVDDIIRLIQEENDDYEKAGEAQPPRDPLIIDLGEKGIKLHNVKNGVYFDLDNNGFAERTAWIDTEDGFLALDRNENGKIDNGGELFGDQVILQDGTISASGFEALGELDENHDKLIDSEDSAFTSLLVWTDTDHNGKSKAGELHTLDELGIISISLEHEENNVVDEETGARIAESAKVIIQKAGNKKVTKISEFWFPVNSSDTTHGDTVTAGDVPDLATAIERDESGTLYSLCCEFAESDDIAHKRFCTKEILYYLTGATDLKQNSRGGNIDARDLKVIEKFMGRKFEGVGGTNPNVNAARMLKEIYGRIEDDYFNVLNLYSKFGTYLKFVFEYQDEKGDTKLNYLTLSTLIQSKLESGKNADALLYDLGMYLRAYDSIHDTDYYKEFSREFSELSEHCRDIVSLSGSGTTYVGTDGNDNYQGTNANEFISGKGGDDTLSGGGGNDRLSGGDGNDTYIFAKGFGHDTVTDSSGTNTIRFQGLKPEDLLVNGTGDYDVTVYIRGTNDSLVIQDFCRGEKYQNYMLEFTKVKMHAADPDSPFRFIYGNDEDNTLKAVLDSSAVYGFDGNDTLYGKDGNDVIYGNGGSDSISAGGGKDIIYGGDGDDILDGGTGDDFLYGGEGNDTYVWGTDYGTDIISDSEGESVIRLAGETAVQNLEVSPAGDNAVISIKDTKDRLVIQGYMDHSKKYFIQEGEDKVPLENYLSGENSSYYSGSENGDYFENDGKEILAGGKGDDRIIGTDDKEYVFGDDGNDQLLFAGGDDVVFGGAGDDYINGGNGNDYIDAGEGKDFADGGSGDDTYVFRQGYGEVSIQDNEGENTIVFGDGLTAESIKSYRSNWNDLLVTFDGHEDRLKLKNYCVNENARGYKLVFSDGTVVDAAAKNSPLKTIYGTDDSEYMPSVYDDGVTKVGQDGDDQLVGSDGNDFLYGGKGNDRMTGLKGDDLLDGGEDNDFLYGGEGNDTYIFKEGYGTDTIGDDSGENTIKISGYSPDQIKAYRTNWNNITVTFGETDDRIVIEGFFNAEANRNFYLEFEGCRIHAAAADSPLRTIYGTDESEYIEAMDDKGVTIFGEAGEDNLNGKKGADRLYGGAGNDQLYGNEGNDVLDGGEGDDCLYGGAGDDTYIFNTGWGTDTIIDSEGINTISFGEGFQAAEMMFIRTNWNNLTIAFAGSDDRLVIRDYFTSENCRNFNVNFADGTGFSYDNEENPVKLAFTTAVME